MFCKLHLLLSGINQTSNKYHMLSMTSENTFNMYFLQMFLSNSCTKTFIWSKLYVANRSLSNVKVSVEKIVMKFAKYYINHSNALCNW